MALNVVRHMNPDNTYSLEEQWTPLEGDELLPPPQIRVVQTGPCGGTVVLDNGNAYDVTPDRVQVHPGEETALAYHCAMIHARSGHLTHLVHGHLPDGTPWVGTDATVEGNESGFQIIPGKAPPDAN